MQFIGNAVHDQLGPETASRRAVNRRADQFVPCPAQPGSPVAVVDGPGNADGAGRLGQHAIFGRIGGKLVDREAQHLRRFGRKLDLRTLDLVVSGGGRLALEFVEYHVVKIDPPAGIAGEDRLNAGQRRQAAVEVADVIVDVLAIIGGAAGDRTDYRQDVAHPVLKLSEEQPLMPLAVAQRRLGATILGDVVGVVDDGLHLAALVEDRRIDRAPPPLFERAVRPSNVILQTRQLVRPTGGKHILQRGAQIADGRARRVVRIVGKSIEQCAPDEFLARPHGRGEIGVVDLGDGESRRVGRKHQERRRRGLEQAREALVRPDARGHVARHPEPLHDFAGIVEQRDRAREGPADRPVRPQHAVLKLEDVPRPDRAPDRLFDPRPLVRWNVGFDPVGRRPVEVEDETGPV